MKPAPSIISLPARARGFTLTELLVVIAVIILLSVFLLPVIAGTKPNAQSFQCLENLRQLTLGWQMYAMDNSGWLAPNGDEQGQPASLAAAQAGSMPQWCPGRQDLAGGFLSADSTPPASNLGYEWIKCGLIYQYVKNVAAYKCPADNATLSSFGQTLHHSRSYSMNQWLSPNTYFTGISPVPLSYYQESSLVNPGPAHTWVFIGENPNSINDGTFICSYPGYADWVDCPASYHNSAGGLAFADGHALLRKWTDPVVLGSTAKWSSYVAGTTGFPDLNYLESASTILPH